MTSRSPDVLVVGGGVIGLSIAWKAAEAGVAATVVDPVPGHAATWASAGMLAPVTEAHYGETELLAASLASAQRWPSFAAELQDRAGEACGYHQSGSIVLAADDDDDRAVTELFAFQQQLGAEVTRLDRAQCRELEPMLSPRIRSGIAVADDHQVDNRVLAATLQAVAAPAGFVIERAEVLEICVSGNRAEAIALADGRRLEASTIVLAAGCWSAGIRGLPESVRPPVRPVKGQIVRLQVEPGALPFRHNLRAWVNGSSVYLVPRPSGEIVVGATSEEMGFDTTVTAGAVHDLLRDAVRLVPALAEVELAEVSAGLRPGSPDNGPIVGPTAVEGLLMATGHYRNGVLLAPLTADAVVAALLGDDAVPEMAPFAPDRFAAGATP